MSCGSGQRWLEFYFLSVCVCIYICVCVQYLHMKQVLLLVLHHPQHDDYEANKKRIIFIIKSRFGWLDFTKFQPLGYFIPKIFFLLYSLFIEHGCYLCNHWYTISGGPSVGDWMFGIVVCIHQPLFGRSQEPMYGTRPWCLVQAITRHTCPDPHLGSWNCLPHQAHIAPSEPMSSIDQQGSSLDSFPTFPSPLSPL